MDMVFITVVGNCGSDSFDFTVIIGPISFKTASARFAPLSHDYRCFRPPYIQYHAAASFAFNPSLPPTGRKTLTPHTYVKRTYKFVQTRYLLRFGQAFFVKPQVRFP